MLHFGLRPASLSEPLGAERKLRRRQPLERGAQQRLSLVKSRERPESGRGSLHGHIDTDAETEMKIVMDIDRNIDIDTNIVDCGSRAVQELLVQRPGVGDLIH